MSRARPWDKSKSKHRAALRAADKVIARERHEKEEAKALADLPVLEEEFKDTYAAHVEKYLDAGRLLQEIKAKNPSKLIKDQRGELKYRTFAAYCKDRFKDRFDFDARRANQIIRAAKDAKILGEPYPKSEGVMRVFRNIIKADPVLARAARDELFNENSNPTAEQTRDFLIDFIKKFLNDDDASALLPPVPQPPTVVTSMRKMERSIKDILSKLPRKHHSTFLRALHLHAQEQVYFAYGLVRVKDARRGVVGLAIREGPGLVSYPESDPPFEEPTAEYPDGRFI